MDKMGIKVMINSNYYFPICFHTPSNRLKEGVPLSAGGNSDPGETYGVKNGK